MINEKCYNLKLGHTVIVDSVNSITVTREAYKDVARSANKCFVEIEMICSDKVEHQKRIEIRTPDIEGHHLPAWEDVMNRDYQRDHHGLVIDTLRGSVQACLDQMIAYLRQYDT